MSDPNDSSIPVLHEILVPGNPAQARTASSGATGPEGPAERGNGERQRGDELLTRVPSHVFGTPNDVAEMVCWLSSDRARFVVGGAFTVDGGYMAN